MAEKVSKAGKWIPLVGMRGPIVLSGDGVVEEVYIDGPEVVTISNCPALTSLFAQSTISNHLQDLTLGSNPALARVEIGSEAMTALDIGSCPAITYCSIEAALTESAVDGILADLDAAGEENGSCFLDSGANSPPSASGLTSKSNLEGKGWTVTVNE